MNKSNEFIKWAKDKGWDITFKLKSELELNNSLITRYKGISSCYVEFLKAVKQCITPSEKTWFLCEDNYNNISNIAFKWNEFELISLEAAEDDREWKEEIVSWWDKHLPIVMSVGEGYSFYAIDLVDDIGSIVQGFEPEFEEVEKVANSIEDFFDLIIEGTIELS